MPLKRSVAYTPAAPVASTAESRSVASNFTSQPVSRSCASRSTMAMEYGSSPVEAAQHQMRRRYDASARAAIAGSASRAR